MLKYAQPLSPISPLDEPGQPRDGASLGKRQATPGAEKTKDWKRNMGQARSSCANVAMF